jgi:phosphatidylinositol kinase/protein kinase (PI-3  family)
MYAPCDKYLNQGMGDRHPSNIMIEHKTARVVHIGMLWYYKDED